MKPVIVNVAVGGDYARRAQFMRTECDRHCGDHDIRFYDGYPDGCPPHGESNYGFKIYAIRDAIKRGFRQILWLDTTIFPVSGLSGFWHSIEQSGWWVPRQGDSKLGTWISDAALAICGRSRDELMGILLPWCAVIAIDLDHGRGAEFWANLEHWYEAGVFNGPHFNVPGRPL